MKKNIFLLFISIFLTLCSLEILVRIYFPQELTTPFRVYGKDGLLLNDKNNEAIHQFEERKIKYKFGSLHNRIYEFEDKNNKILTLGDSFTFGWLIDDKDTFIYKLNNIFDDYLTNLFPVRLDTLLSELIDIQKIHRTRAPLVHETRSEMGEFFLSI